MSDKLPAVDIIIVNYNGMEHLPGCLGSLFKTDYPFFSTTLVDNDSQDGSVEWVKKNYPEVRVIRNSQNLGFGKANNIGIEETRSPYTALLNSDTVVEKGWLRPLVETAHKDPSIAATCSKLLFLQNPRIVNGVGGGMNYVGYGYDIGAYEVNNGQFDEESDVFFPTAAACVLKRSAFEEVGGFDERFFMYHEDVDLGWRLRLKGYGIKCVTDSVVHHAFGGTSLKSGSMAFRNNLGQRHALRSLIKNYEFATLTKVLPLFIAMGLRNTIRGQSPDFLKCLLWNVKRLPDTLYERKRIQKTRKIKDKKLTSLIWQDIPMPFRFPDYTVMNLESFSGGKRRVSAFDMSDSQPDNLGYGWHGVEVFFGDGRTRYRWSKEEAVFHLWNDHGEGTLSLDVLGLSETLKRNRTFSICINGGESYEQRLSSDNWETVTVPYYGEPGPLEIRLVMGADTWSPHDQFKNGDHRRLGIGVRGAEFLPAHSTPSSLDGISVIIPTYNRIENLLKVLQSLEAQKLDRTQFEVIIVDDGSTDSTEKDLRKFMGESSLHMKYFKQANKKQGAARNLGLQHAKMPLIAFIGDDIIPTPDFLGEHLRFHRKNNRDGKICLIGYTTWPEDIRITPFMEYIGEYGYQFGYSLIHGNGPLPFNFFYTSNISIPKALLDDLEYVFEEDFDTYGWEDAELGYRLENRGMRLFYNASAIAYHDHPVDISSFCRRQLNVGKASRIFVKKHPELEGFLGDRNHLRKWARLTRGLVAVQAPTNFVDRRFLLPLPHALYGIILKANYAKGALNG